MSSKESPQTSDFRILQLEKVLKKPDLEALHNWYHEQLKKFGEIIVVPAPLTDGNKWKRELTPNGEVDNIDGSFFTLIGQTVSKYNPDGTIAFQWTQPGLIQKEGEVSLLTNKDQTKIKISGIVGVIKNDKNQILLSMVQEPFAHSPKKVLIRTPLQTSFTKFQGILDGKRELDPVFFDFITSISPGKNPDEIFKIGILDTFLLPYADANRIDATNIGFSTKIDNPELINKFQNNGQNRWCSLYEISALAKVGLLNGHTSSAILATL